MLGINWNWLTESLVWLWPCCSSNLCGYSCYWLAWLLAVRVSNIHLYNCDIYSPFSGRKVCADGSAPTCENGSPPARDQDRSTPPCPGQGRGRRGKANTCADGSSPTKVKKAKKGGRGGGRQGRCSKSEKICCDGSSPSFDQDRSTPQCEDGGRAKCSVDLCENWVFLHRIKLNIESTTKMYKVISFLFLFSK